MGRRSERQLNIYYGGLNRRCLEMAAALSGQSLQRYVETLLDRAVRESCKKWPHILHTAALAEDPGPPDPDDPPGDAKLRFAG